jgi:hypothetical protein
MDWKVLFFLIFCLVSTGTHARKATKQKSLQLRGVVPLKVGVNLVEGRNGALIPTLQSNNPSSLALPVRLKTSRSPASVGEVHRVVIESY